MTETTRPRVAIIGCGSTSTSAHKLAMIQSMILAGAKVEYVSIENTGGITGRSPTEMIFDEIALHPMPDLDQPALEKRTKGPYKPYFRRERW